MSKHKNPKSNSKPSKKSSRNQPKPQPTVLAEALAAAVDSKPSKPILALPQYTPRKPVEPTIVTDHTSTPFNAPAGTVDAPLVDSTFESAEAYAQVAGDKAHQTPEQRIKSAIEDLENFRFDGWGKRLYDIAIDQTMRNRGDALPDAFSRARVAMQADSLAAAEGDIIAVCEAFVATVADQKQVPGMCYSLCNSVMKSAVFIGNVWYRKACTFEEQYYNKHGERMRTPHDNANELMPEELAGQLAEVEGHNPDEVTGQPTTFTKRQLEADDPGYSPEEIIDALIDVNLFLSSVVESFGWTGNSLPYCSVVVDPVTPTYRGVTNPLEAFDVEERKRRARDAKKAAAMVGQLERMREALRAKAGKTAAA